MDLKGAFHRVKSRREHYFRAQTWTLLLVSARRYGNVFIAKSAKNKNKISAKMLTILNSIGFSSSLSLLELVFQSETNSFSVASKSSNLIENPYGTQCCRNPQSNTHTHIISLYLYTILHSNLHDSHTGFWFARLLFFARSPVQSIVHSLARSRRTMEQGIPILWLFNRNEIIYAHPLIIISGIGQKSFANDKNHRDWFLLRACACESHHRQ